LPACATWFSRPVASYVWNADVELPKVATMLACADSEDIVTLVSGVGAGVIGDGFV
jgi:hypothetical protein